MCMSVQVYADWCLYAQQPVAGEFGTQGYFVSPGPRDQQKHKDPIRELGSMAKNIQYLVYSIWYMVLSTWYRNIGILTTAMVSLIPLS